MRGGGTAGEMVRCGHGRSPGLEGPACVSGVEAPESRVSTQTAASAVLPRPSYWGVGEFDRVKIAGLRKAKVSVLNHPVIQSLALPFMLTAASVFILRALPGTAGLRWAPLGAVLGLLAALAVLPGFDWPATARAHQLPWIVLTGAALSALSMAPFSESARAGPWAAWLAAVLCWAGSSGWMAGGGASWAQVVPIVLAGASVLALLAWGGPLAAAALTVAALGLTALAGRGGSLLLAQWALMLA
ncbi:MAG TPA: hypothetical protein VLM87_10410, partial [Rubrivivax sp.]|nr:hypothetical protein [Rubrivivax sp.]